MDVAAFDAFRDNVLFDSEQVRQSGVVTAANPNPLFVLRDDVRTALSLPPKADNGAWFFSLRSDVARRTLGFYVGSLAELNPVSSVMQLPVGVTPGMTFGEFQTYYCPQVYGMYVAGDQLDPRDAVLSGLIQARVSQRPPMSARTDGAIGVVGPCSEFLRNSRQ